MLLFSSTIAIFLNKKGLTMETKLNVLIDTPIFCHDLSTIQEQTKKRFLLEHTCWLLAVGGILVWRIVHHRQMHHNSPDPLHHPLQHPLDLGNLGWGHQPWGLLPTLLKLEYPIFFPPPLYHRNPPWWWCNGFPLSRSKVINFGGIEISDSEEIVETATVTSPLLRGKVVGGGQ